MQRDSVDAAVMYAPDDLVLYRESPFAAWMERLTLENPEHGIPPDIGVPAPGVPTESLDDIVTTLRAEGRNVAHIGADQTLFERREDTLTAMRNGSDFIINGFMSQDEIGATAGLLMRTSGFSSLGNFLYIPCEAGPSDPRNSPFRLCVLAELLLAVQKQLPPQMLVISGGADLTPLQTDDHIHYYRAVKARFLEAMGRFRKHKMPDPGESAFFGRWSECASEVLKQRHQRDEMLQEEGEDQAPEEIEEIVVELPRVQAAGAGNYGASEDIMMTSRADQTSMLVESAVSTLAEQASQLAPGSYHAGDGPGHTPNLARVAPLRAVASTQDHSRAVVTDAEREAGSARRSGSDIESLELELSEAGHPARRSSDLALENLEFIGSAPGTLMGPEPLLDVAPAAQRQTFASEPARESFAPESPRPELEGLDARSRAPLPELEPRAPLLLPPEPDLAEAAQSMPPLSELRPHPLDSRIAEKEGFIDMDGVPPAALSPQVDSSAERGDQSAMTAIERLCATHSEAHSRGSRKISDSLITGKEFEDLDEP